MKIVNTGDNDVSKSIAPILKAMATKMADITMLVMYSRTFSLKILCSFSTTAIALLTFRIVMMLISIIVMKVSIVSLAVTHVSTPNSDENNDAYPK